MILYDPLDKIEWNALFFHYCQHLISTLLIFGAYPVYLIYMQEVERLAKELNIIVINFTICPTHPHLILKARDAAVVQIFVKRLNSSFSNILRNLEGGRYWKGGKLFLGKPHLTPITSFRQLLECSIYVHHNNDGLFGTKMAKGGIFNNWNSSFRRYEDGSATKKNDYLLALLNLENHEYLSLFWMDRDERRKILDEIETEQDERLQDQVFKKNPDLPYATEVKAIRFINDSELLDPGIIMKHKPFNF
ncbi:MAG: hypothetical protein WC117_05340 [Sphaerochaetaceae bacterium]